MATNAKVVADSINPAGCRLTTIECTYPHIIHSHLLKHRIMSSNTSSSRAVPTKVLIEQVRTDPFTPKLWGSAKSGMKSGPPLEGEDAEWARAVHLTAANTAIAAVILMVECGVHKEYANRYLEPFLWTTSVISATNWSNFFHLRLSEAAQGETKELANVIKAAIDASTPQQLQPGEFHLPYVDAHEIDGIVTDANIAASVARTGRISYQRQGLKQSPEKDMEFYLRGIENGHWSCYEHVGCAMADDSPSGNFRGFTQLRKTFKNECY